MKRTITILLLLFFHFTIIGQCWKSVSLNSSSTLVLDDENQLYACGFNFSLQLGIGNEMFSVDTLVEVSPKSRWRSVSCGNFHALGVKEDGTLWAWGSNQYGQLGIGNTQSQEFPIQIGDEDDWLEVNAGYEFSVAMKEDSTLWAWGRNTFGQLGIGDTSDKWSPRKVSDEKWSSYTIGNVHVLALQEDGSLWAWGNNINGQLGDGTTTESVIPKLIAPESEWTAISSEGLHTLALKKDGTLWAWGNNVRGQLGIDSMINKITSPIQVGTENNWKYINSSGSISAGIKEDGTLWLWGSNERGQLGNLDSIPQLFPIQFNDDTDWSSIGLGNGHVAGIKTDKTLYMWGGNTVGQLGIGNDIDTHIPIKIQCKYLLNTEENTLKEKLKIYPNPAKTVFNYHSSKAQTLTIYTLNGEESDQLEVVEGQNSCDISSLNPGLYILVDEEGRIQKLHKVD